MTTFKELPKAVQQAVRCLHLSRSECVDLEFKTDQAQGFNGVWVAPQLCYDFRESCYDLLTVNLVEVAKLYVGPAMATAYTKIDPNLPAWLIIDEGRGDTGNQVYECVLKNDCFLNSLLLKYNLL